MNVIIEGVSNPIEFSNILPDEFITKKDSDNKWTTDYVGYYSDSNGILTFILPKTFSKKYIYFDSSDNTSSYNEKILSWPLTVYSVIKKYRQEIKNSVSTKNRSNLSELVLNKQDGEYTLLDIMIELIRIHREYPFIYFREKTEGSKSRKRINWKKTIKSKIPLIGEEDLFYFDIVGSGSKSSDSEFLLIVFYSTLYKISKILNIRIEINEMIPIIKNHKMDKLEKRVGKLLKNSKHRYYTDLHRKIHFYLTEYYKQTNHSATRKKQNEYLLVSSFHTVFERMVDSLISDSQDMKYFKDNNDGKILDHIFHGRSIFSEEDIDCNTFFIGDSKYYSNVNSVKGNSYNIYKQYTYAANIYNLYVDAKHGRVIDPEISKHFSNENIYLWDRENRSYNPIVSFFVLPSIDDSTGYDTATGDLFFSIKGDYGRIQYDKTFHYEERVFDRNTMYILYYYVDLKKLMVLYSSSTGCLSEQKKIREMIRNDAGTLYREDYEFNIEDSKKENQCDDGIKLNLEKTVISGIKKNET